MRISPVQTKSIIFRKVSIEPLLDEEQKTVPNLRAQGFDWDEVTVGVDTGVGVREDQGKSPTEFLVTLGIRVMNETGKQCPYKFDTQVVGLLEVAETLPLSRREELVEVNGLAILYGAMREMIVGITSRMEYGPLVLPGVNFMDHVEKADARVADAKPAKD
jgi:preprotein translocase subunit SecB